MMKQWMGFVNKNKTILFCIFLGALISVLPHLLFFIKCHLLFWVSNEDELEIYLPIAAKAYFNHPGYFSDPVFESFRPTTFPWIQFFPVNAVISLFSLGPEWIGFLWRLLAGSVLGLTWYLVIHQEIKSKWIAAVLAGAVLADSGYIYDHFISTQLFMLNRLFTSLPQNDGMVFWSPQWRIMNPALSLGFLLLYYLTLSQIIVQPGLQSSSSQIQPSQKQILWTGFSFGLLFWVYFYYWTVALLSLSILLCIDPKNRTRYLQVLILGLIIGFPSLIWDAYLKFSFSSDWLQRSDRFVSIPHFSELMISKAEVTLIFLSGVYVFHFQKRLIWLWVHCLGGFLLLNHQILTGLQIENFHWIYSFSPTFLLFGLWVTYALYQSLNSNLLKKILATTAVLILVIDIAAGFYTRKIEFESGLKTPALGFLVQKFYEQRNLVGPFKFQPQAVLAGDNLYVQVSTVLDNTIPLFSHSVRMSPSISNDEFYDRIASNLYLKNLDQAQALLDWNNFKMPGPWRRHLELKKEQTQKILNRLFSIRKDPASMLRRFSVRYLALENGRLPPEHASFRWNLRQQGPHWSIYEIAFNP